MATLGWSLSGLFVRFMPDLTGWQINCWRGFWMATALLVYMVIRYGDRFPEEFRKLPAVALWVSAICFAVGTTLYVTSLTLVSTATVSVIGAASPLITGLMSPWVTGERPSVYSWIAAVIALVGMAIISFDGLETGRYLGILTSLGVMMTFATQTLLLRRYRDLDMMPAICVGGLLAFVGNGLLGATTPGQDGWGGFSVDMNSMLLLALMGPVQLAVPLICYARGARYISAMVLSLLAMLDAVLNPLWSWLAVGEVPETPAVIGGAIIIGAVLMSTIGAYFAERRAV
jgi:drug/metabolite transporter, DME family